MELRKLLKLNPWKKSSVKKQHLWKIRRFTVLITFKIEYEFTAQMKMATFNCVCKCCVLMSKIIAQIAVCPGFRQMKDEHVGK